MISGSGQMLNDVDQAQLLPLSSTTQKVLLYYTWYIGSLKKIKVETL